MAAASLAGEPITTIAQNEALSREWVRRELASDECCQIITGLVNRQHNRAIELVSLTMNAIQEALRVTRKSFFPFPESEDSSPPRCSAKLHRLSPIEITTRCAATQALLPLHVRAERKQ
jgi:hypothetical protein